MRYLVYLLTLFFIGTAIAQNPTIVQGDYITNVFGPSNFVKNPNAQINTANVTVSNATVTRGTTTPLVAKSEFTITTSTATGYADWDLRAFDAGMKNNNCEARFTYRGFTVGSTKAQILQGANVVAELTLIGDANNPKQASINFPCGDLSAVTKFRLQQATASLTGTNEIGGIYVGLATNMANVAQAEMVGAVQWQGCALPEPARTGSTAFGNFSGGGSCSGKTLFGKATSANEADASITFNNLPAGYYFLQTNTFAYIAAPTTASIVGQVEVYEDTSGAMSGRTYIQSQVANTLVHTPTPSGWYYFATTANRTFRLRGSISNAANTLQVSLGFSGVTQATQFALYRFPSSSELVVTPERQNVFGEISGTGTDSTTTSTSYVTPSGFSPIYSTGRCTNDGTNLACKISTLPPGTYKVDVSMPYFAVAGGAGPQNCWVQITDNKGAIDAPTAQASSNTSQNDGISSVSRTFTYNSVQTDVIFSVRHRQIVGGAGGQCGLYTSGGKYFTMAVTPLNQPSNSALYVQGPVLGAQTGAAIPSGYAGQSLSVLKTTATNLATATWTEVTNLTLTPGVWLLTGSAHWNRNGANMTVYDIACGLAGSTASMSANYSAGNWFNLRTSIEYTSVSAPFNFWGFAIRPNLIRNDGTNLYFGDGATFVSGSQTVRLVCYSGSFSAGTPVVYGAIEAVRLN